jgi:hypothetical protein
MITKQNLIDLGFTLTKGDEGTSTEYHFYLLQIGSITLLTKDNLEINFNDPINIHICDDQNELTVSNYQNLIGIIEIFKNIFGNHLQR